MQRCEASAVVNIDSAHSVRFHSDSVHTEGSLENSPVTHWRTIENSPVTLTYYWEFTGDTDILLRIHRWRTDVLCRMSFVRYWKQIHIRTGILIHSNCHEDVGRKILLATTDFLQPEERTKVCCCCWVFCLFCCCFSVCLFVCFWGGDSVRSLIILSLLLSLRKLVHICFCCCCFNPVLSSSKCYFLVFQ